MKTVFFLLNFLFFLITSFALFSQKSENWNEEGKIKDTEIIIKKEREITLPEVNRNFEKIKTNRKKEEVSPQQFNYQPVTGELGAIDTRLRLQKIKGEQKANVFGNYIQAGFGNYITPFFEGHITNTNKDNYSYGIHARHFSSARGPADDRKNAAFSNNSIQVNGSYFLENAEIYGSLNYDFDKYHYYGYDQSLEVDKDSISQNYHTFNGGIGIKNTNNDNTFTYDIQSRYYFFSGRYNVSEGESLTKLNAGYQFNEAVSLDVSSDLSFSSKTDSIGQINRNLITFKPIIEYNKDKLQLAGGFNIAHENDTVKKSKSFHFYPVIKGSYSITPSISAYARLGGGIQKNNFRTYANKLPFVAPNITLAHTNNKLELAGGIKGVLANAWNFNLNISSNNYDNLHFFVNDPADTSKFQVIYDPENSNVINISGNISYDRFEKFKIGLQADYFAYNLDTISNNWHRPEYKFQLYSNYNLGDKVYFYADIFYIGGLEAYDFNDQKKIALDDIVDINLKANYKLTSKADIFIEINNILNNKYQRYLNYPRKGINLLVGGGYSF